MEPLGINMYTTQQNTSQRSSCFNAVILHTYIYRNSSDKQSWECFLTQHREPSRPAVSRSHNVAGLTHIGARVFLLCRSNDKLPNQLLQQQAQCRQQGRDRMHSSVNLLSETYTSNVMCVWLQSLCVR